MFLGTGSFVLFRLTAKGRALFESGPESSDLLAAFVVEEDDHGVWVSMDDEPDRLRLVKWSQFATAEIDYRPTAEPRRIRIGF
jgi:hypothetical protein